MAKKVSAKERQLNTLDKLMDWLLEEEVSFTKLDAFRKQLNLDEDSFTKLLGISKAAYGQWRRNRAVPLQNRDEKHENVLGYQKVYKRSQNTRFDAVLGGLESINNPVWKVIAPSKTTPSEPNFANSPSLYLPLSEAIQRRDKAQARENLIREIQEKHRPHPGDLYEACECEFCQIT